jgi:putative transposase
MGSAPPLLSFLLIVAAGWVHRHQLIVIEFLQAENRLLKDRLRGKRIRFTDAERALLARKAKAVGRKGLMELETIVSPDTLLRWHRRLIAEKWNFVHRRGPGRPGIMQEISDLIVRMAQDNPGWGYTRIQGALGNLRHRVGRGTIANVLKRSGIEPSPERSKRTTWSTFLKAHWKVLAASDFLTVEVWTTRGLVTHYLLFVISLADRVVDIVGITTRPDEAWMLQVGRNLIDAESGAMRGKGYLILRSGHQVHGLIPPADPRQWDERHPATTTIAEPERIRGAICSLDQVRMPEPDDLHRAGVVAPCGGRIRGPLPRGTKPSRARQRTDL